MKIKSNKITILLVGLLTSGGLLNAQEVELQWANGFGSTSSDLGRGICVDQAGDIITTGGFRETTDFDPSASENNLVSNLGSEDIYVTKYDVDGNLIWALSFGSYNHERGEEVITDADNNIYVIGRYFNVVDFDPGAGTTELTAVGGASDVFVLKLDAEGNFIWAKSFGGNLTDQGLSIDLSSSGDVYISGSYGGTGDFDPGPGVFELTAVDGAPSSIFAVKLDSDGNFIWAKSVGGDSGNNFGFGIVVDDSDNSYITGGFGGTGDFDPGAGTEMLVTYGYDDIFILKLDADGGMVWAKNVGSGYGEWADDINLDASGNLLLTGYFRLTVDFDPGAGTAELTTVGGQDSFVLKLTADGDYVWAGQFGGTGADSQGLHILSDASDNMYLTGKYSGMTDFDPGAGVEERTAVGGTDIFVLKLSASGEYQWVKSMGGSLEDFGGNTMALDADDNVYLTGSFQDDCDFNTGGSPYEIGTLGLFDIFMLKLGECEIDLAVTESGLVLTSAQDGATYRWLNCDESYAEISGETGQTYEAAADGNFAVEITMGACVDTSECLAIAGVGINESSQQISEIKLYPNPATNYLVLKSSEAIIQVSIYDVFGRLVQVENESGFGIQGLANGVYIANIRTENQVYSLQFVKE